MASAHPRRALAPPPRGHLRRLRHAGAASPSPAGPASQPRPPGGPRVDPAACVSARCERDLQDLGELRVDRCHRSWNGTLDDGQRVACRNRQCGLQFGRAIERGPRRKLSGNSRALNHLFRLQEVVDQTIGRLWLIAVRIDRQRPILPARPSEPLRGSWHGRDPDAPGHGTTATASWSSHRHTASCA